MEVSDFFSLIKIPSTIAHVIAVVVGMGSALASDMLFTFYAKDRRLNPTERKTLDRLSTVVWYSLVAISITGIALVFSDVEKYTASDKLLAKLTILGILVLNGYILSKRIWPHLIRPGFFTARRERAVRKMAFVGGAISITSWLSVCTLGVLDASPAPYITIMGGYAIIVIAAVFVALIVEDRKLERGRIG